MVLEGVLPVLVPGQRGRSHGKAETGIFEAQKASGQHFAGHPAPVSYTHLDAKDYIPRTVRSILAQSFTDFELLLVEDGSPNGCGELCDELAKTDPRIRVFHKENGGPASALNVGLDNARGDYIGFVDSDDLVDPDLYETLLNAIRENDVRIACLLYTSRCV